MRDPRAAAKPSSGETYLLTGLGCCGECGASLRVFTNKPRKHDGARCRRYVCSSHRTHRGHAQCTAGTVDAHTAEAMLTEHDLGLVVDLCARGGIECARPRLELAPALVGGEQLLEGLARSLALERRAEPLGVGPRGSEVDQPFWVR